MDKPILNKGLDLEAFLFDVPIDGIMLLIKDYMRNVNDNVVEVEALKRLLRTEAPIIRKIARPEAEYAAITPEDAAKGVRELLSLHYIIFADEESKRGKPEGLYFKLPPKIKATMVFEPA